jgi:hypothetical protein
MLVSFSGGLGREALSPARRVMSWARPLATPLRLHDGHQRMIALSRSEPLCVRDGLNMHGHPCTSEALLRQLMRKKRSLPFAVDVCRIMQQGAGLCLECALLRPRTSHANHCYLIRSSALQHATLLTTMQTRKKTKSCQAKPSNCHGRHEAYLR